MVPKTSCLAGALGQVHANGSSAPNQHPPPGRQKLREVNQRAQGGNRRRRIPFHTHPTTERVNDPNRIPLGGKRHPAGVLRLTHRVSYHPFV